MPRIKMFLTAAGAPPPATPHTDNTLGNIPPTPNRQFKHRFISPITIQGRGLALVATQGTREPASCGVGYVVKHVSAFAARGPTCTTDGAGPADAGLLADVANVRPDGGVMCAEARFGVVFRGVAATARPCLWRGSGGDPWRARARCVGCEPFVGVSRCSPAQRPIGIVAVWEGPRPSVEGVTDRRAAPLLVAVGVGWGTVRIRYVSLRQRTQVHWARGGHRRLALGGEPVGG